MNLLEANSKNKNIRDLYMGISDFKKGQQSRTNTLKNEKGNLFAASHSILTRWRTRQTEIRTAEPLVPISSAFEALEKRRRHKSLGIDRLQHS